MKSDILYVAPYFVKWEDLQMVHPIGHAVSIKTPDGIPGLCFVFESLDKMREVYPDVDERKVALIEVKL